MKIRTTYPNQMNAKWYFDKGIKCGWKSYGDFKSDMYQEYLKHISIFGKKDTSLDRIDSNGNYDKSNCRWIRLCHQQRKDDVRLSTI